MKWCTQWDGQRYSRRQAPRAEYNYSWQTFSCDADRDLIDVRIFYGRPAGTRAQALLDPAMSVCSVHRSVDLPSKVVRTRVLTAESTRSRVEVVFDHPTTNC